MAPPGALAEGLPPTQATTMVVGSVCLEGLMRVRTWLAALALGLALPTSVTLAEEAPGQIPLPSSELPAQPESAVEGPAAAPGECATGMDCPVGQPRAQDESKDDASQPLKLTPAPQPRKPERTAPALLTRHVSLFTSVPLLSKNAVLRQGLLRLRAIGSLEAP